MALTFHLTTKIPAFQDRKFHNSTKGYSLFLFETYYRFEQSKRLFTSEAYQISLVLILTFCKAKSVKKLFF